MPKISRWFVFSALFYLILSLTAGALRLLPAHLIADLAFLNSFPAYLHLWTIGWLTQLIFGIAYWLLPVIDRQQGRGPAWPMVASFLSLNVGLPLRAMTEATQATAAAESTTLNLLALSALLLWLSGILFAASIWRRIK